MSKFGVLALACLMFWSCGTDNGTAENETENENSITMINTETINGKEVKTFELKNKNGTTIHITNYGAIVTKMLVADKEGNLENIVLGFDSVSEYQQNGYYFGATAGRYANRIAKGRFSIDGEAFQLTTNDGQNHLHGGNEGFNEVVWEAESFEDNSGVGVRMVYVSPDGEEGYPGELTTTATFSLDDNDVLTILYEASTDKATIVNITHHGYFNLSAMKEDILNHELTIYGDHYTPVDETLIPTGDIVEVNNTPFDFTSAHKIGERIAQVEGGYDHNYVITKEYTGDLKKQAELYHSGSGRLLEVHSDAPGVQFYSGNFLDGAQGTDGNTYNKHTGLCLEPQFFPDSPNQPNFPSASLKPGETYSHRIELHFKTR
ncbi:aldose epimerase family protein [Anditalea andensis]|nr:aldose epimerase family protein [Anditalea andensis]